MRRDWGAIFIVLAIFVIIALAGGAAPVTY